MKRISVNLDEGLEKLFNSLKGDDSALSESQFFVQLLLDESKRQSGKTVEIDLSDPKLKEKIDAVKEHDGLSIQASFIRHMERAFYTIAEGKGQRKRIESIDIRTQMLMYVVWKLVEHTGVKVEIGPDSITRIEDLISLFKERDIA